MALRVNNNIAALNAYRNLTVSEGHQSKALEKLSSGYRINRAADDAAGLAISETLRSQVGGLKVASRNAQDGVSVVQTAEGALTEVHSMLQRMRDLAVQAANSGANGGAGGDAVKAAQAEVVQLQEAVDQIAGTTQFNGTKLLDNSGPLTFQVGANSALARGAVDDDGNALVDGNTLSVNLKDVRTTALGRSVVDDEGVATAVEGGTIKDIDLTKVYRGSNDDGFEAVDGTADDFAAEAGDISGAAFAVDTIDAAIKQVSSFRADLGAAQNRLEHTIANLSVTAENLTASESRIRDADMAQEMLGFTRSQILSQAGTAMLAQANQSSQGVLSLLR